MHASQAEDATVSAKLIKSVAANLEISGKYSRGGGEEGEARVPARKAAALHFWCASVTWQTDSFRERVGGREESKVFSMLIDGLQ